MGEESFTEWSGTAIRIAQEGIAAAEYRGQDFDQEHLAWCRKVLGDHRRQIVYELAQQWAACYDRSAVEGYAKYQRDLLKLFGVDQRNQDLASATKQRTEVFAAASEYAAAFADNRLQGMVAAEKSLLAAFGCYPDANTPGIGNYISEAVKAEELGTGTFSRMTANELSDVHLRNQYLMFPEGEEEAPPKLLGEMTLKELIERHPQYQMTDWERRTLDRVSKRKRGEVPTFPSDSGTWGKATDMAVESVPGAPRRGDEYRSELDSLSGKERHDLMANSWDTPGDPRELRPSYLEREPVSATPAPGGNGVTIKGKELYGKYVVTRTDGARVDGDRLFVLSPDTDISAKHALAYYAELMYRSKNDDFAAALTAHYDLPGGIPVPDREHVEEIKKLELRISQLYSLAEKMIGMELGARQEQIKALALAGIVVTEAEHIERAINCSNGFNRDLEAIMGRKV